MHLNTNKIGLYLLYAYAIICGISRAGSHIVIGLLCITFIAHCIKNRRNLSAILPINIFKWLGLLSFSLLVSSIFSIDVKNSLMYSVQFIYFILPIFYGLVFITDIKDIKRIILTMIFSVSINAASNLVQFSSGVVRTRGFLGIMDTSALMGMTIPIIYTLILNYLIKKETKYFLPLFVSIGLCFVSLYTNDTRIGLYGSILAIFVALILKYKYINIKAVILPITLISLVALFFYSTGYFEKKPIVIVDLNNNEIAVSTNSSNSKRVAMWKYGIELFSKNTIIGIGSGCIPSFTFDQENNLLPLNTLGKKDTHVHSVIIQILATTGIFGLITFLLFWLKAIILPIRKLTKNIQHNSIYSSIIITSFAYFFLNGLTDFLLLKLPMYFFAIIISLSYKGLLLEKEDI